MAKKVAFTNISKKDEPSNCISARADNKTGQWQTLDQRPGN